MYDAQGNPRQVVTPEGAAIAAVAAGVAMTLFGEHPQVVDAAVSVRYRFEYWQAAWDEKGTRRTAKFSIAKYKNGPALEMAKKKVRAMKRKYR